MLPGRGPAPNCQSPRGSLNPRLAPRVPSPRCRSPLIWPRAPQTAHGGIKRKPPSLQRSALPASARAAGAGAHVACSSVLAGQAFRQEPRADFGDRASPCPGRASCKVHSPPPVPRALLAAGRFGRVFVETKRAKGGRTKWMQLKGFKGKLVEKGLPLSPSRSHVLT